MKNCPDLCFSYVSSDRPVVYIDMQQNSRVEPGLDSLVPNFAGPEFSSSALPVVISADGQTILYTGTLFDGPLVATSDNTHQNVYAIDISERAAALVSRGTNQTGRNSRSIFPRFSNNDQSVVYFSDASNLIEGDNNLRSDIFITPLQSE